MLSQFIIRLGPAQSRIFPRKNMNLGMSISSSDCAEARFVYHRLRGVHTTSKGRRSEIHFGYNSVVLPRADRTHVSTHLRAHTHTRQAPNSHSPSIM